MSYQPIENYGMIGNMRTVALVGVDGSIDWYCHPHFDSPSVFGALLDDSRGGRFRISPVAELFKHKQFYWPSTNILITRFLTADGIAEIEDFMPVGPAQESPWYHYIYRRVRCVRGAMAFSVLCCPAFDYGRKRHETAIEENGAVFRTDEASFALSTAVPLRLDDQGGVAGEFILQEGESRVFLFKNVDAVQCPCPPPEEEAEELFQNTVKYWQKWLSACTYHGRWREQVQRSALALKLLTFEPTGAIIAAPTTSLPEVIGGSRNWDYRYTWLRDAAFTVYGFLRIGFVAEAAAFVSWLEGCAAQHFVPGQALPVVLTVGGDCLPPEQTLDHWEGYRRSGPVRIGNAAASQFQIDIHGELMDALYLYNKYVSPISYDVWVKIRERLDWICDNWHRPDEGIWEMRNRREHFIYSKVMNWVALDRGLRLADKRSFPARHRKWQKERDRIYEEVMSHGWNEQRRAFTQFYGSNDLDASLLIMPLVFFLAPTDPRMLGTIEAILDYPKNGGLASDSLVYRYPPQPRVDGLPGEEGTFNMCSFWLVEALTRAGRANPEKLNQARLLFERMLGYANHLGLYAEQTGSQGEALGNFPQAFTHLALISAAFNLDRTLSSRF
ncbi:glycoside hydrolase family 15 protein [Geotalea sp. SG265]|uniref:glycoside hydrolase family 15 protein n=1 Tax=Geotalea sp. SG265 TaxID=2922867 RepID=UPI001FAF0CA0|nr:glycoside hydrolase family 15 protein [Geotalea sp. SG265]